MPERDRDAHVPRGANDVDYGWRAGSAALPRAARAIENVSASSMVKLRAVVLSERERARTARATAAVRGRADARTTLARGCGRGSAGADGRNRGVEARAAADGDGARAGGVEASASGVRTALERKAVVYERLSRGEIVDEGWDGDERAVDFDAKARERDADADGWARPGMGLMSDDMRRELERREWERGIEAEELEAERAAAARRVVFDIERETERERDAREDAKRRRVEEDDKRREKLKAKFLQSKLKGAKK